MTHRWAAIVVAAVNLAIDVLFVILVFGAVLAIFVIVPVLMAVGGNPWPLIIVGALALVVSGYLALDWWGHKA